MRMVETAQVLHLAQGDVTAALLRAAIRAGNLHGEVFAIPEDFSHGPLDDGAQRLAYFRGCYIGFGPWDVTATDAFAPWHDLANHVIAGPPAEIAIWAGENASEGTFLAMASARLGGGGWALSQVRPAPGTYTGQYRPEALAAFFPAREIMPTERRALLARDFARIRAETGLLRRWEGGRIIGVHPGHYDGLLVSACGASWRPAARVVGAAMAACEPANLLSDVFLAARLQALIGSGRIEADKSGSGLRDFAVRLRRDAQDGTVRASDSSTQDS